MKGLVVESKADRVANFQTRTVNSACEIVGAMGCASPSEVRPTQLMMRQSAQQVTLWSTVLDLHFIQFLAGHELCGGIPLGQVRVLD